MTRIVRCRLLNLALLILVNTMLLWRPGSLSAQPSGIEQGQNDESFDPISWDRNVRSIVAKNCLDCHSESDPSGDVNLEQDTDVRQILDHRETWTVALDLVKSGEMPPKEDSSLKDEHRLNLIGFLEKTLNSLDCEAMKDPGKPILRRLNRVEYDNAIEDIFGLKLGLAAGFAPDATSYGFDNIGEALTFSPVQIEQYHAAARTLVEALATLKNSNRRRYDSIFGIPANDQTPTRETALSAIQAVASKAFRRPVDRNFIEELGKIYDLAVSKGESHEQAVSYLISAVVISPQFLIRIEQNHTESDDPYPVDDYELASRLSYFLWSRAPDRELYELAAAGKLQSDEVLEAQVERMLRDERAIALVKNFFGQWLSLRTLDDHQPDRQVFPEFDESLRQAMRDEVHLSLLAMLRKNQPITEIISSKSAYLNARLAKHYGIDGVTSDELVEVDVSGTARGGILTSAALLMLQSDPGRTNVPRRGNFIAGQVLGTPPPPPPPDVPELEEISSDGKPRPLREVLEIHRSNPECASCHAKMDPYGLALENFDAIGRWRSKDGPFPIDPTSKLANGKELNGPQGLKEYLLSQQDKFRRHVIKNLLIYALGRGLKGNDECVIREVIAASKKHDDRIGSIVTAIVKSYPFRYRRNPLE